MDIQPAPYRSNLYRHLTGEVKAQLHQAYKHVLEWIEAMETQAPDPDAPLPAAAATQQHHYTSTPLWHLLLIFDQLLLHPAVRRTKLSPNEQVQERLRLFRSGAIPDLWISAQTKHPHNSAHASPEDLAHQAQVAADEDNYHTAFARVTKAMPVASMNERNQATCKKLYPPKTAYQSTHRHTRSSQITPSIIHQDSLLSALKQVQRGTAAGPLADFPERLKDFALWQPQAAAKDYYPNFGAFTAIAQRITNASVPTTVKQVLSSNWFMALHKDTNRPDALRPIGMGTAWRRILGKYNMILHSTAIAEMLTPLGQFGISVRGGIDFIVHSTRVAISRYMQPGHETRAIPLLDLENMFNKASREAARDKLLSHPQLRAMVPFFDLLYDDIIQCFFMDDQGSIECFLQIEGHCQGCPLGPLFSCLTLLHLLEKLKPMLEARAAARTKQNQTGDDGRGTEGFTVAFFDDCTPVLAPEDIEPYLELVRTEGKPLGLSLNYTKTKILTTTTGISVTAAPPTARTRALCSALKYIQRHAPEGVTVNPELTTGARLLGQPIGALAFARTFLAQALQQCITNLSKLKHSGLDRHSCLLLFTSCAQPSLTHLFQSDVYCNAPLPAPEDVSLFHWNSPLTRGIAQANKLFLAHIADAPPDSFTGLSDIVTHHPAALGGLGHREPAAVALPLTLISITRSIQCATRGLTVAGGKTIPLAPVYSRIFAAWQTSTKHTFGLCRTCAPLLQLAHNEVAADAAIHSHNLGQFISTVSLQGLSSKIYALHRKRTLSLFLEQAAPDQLVCFPSILSPLTSSPLTLYYRTKACNRLKDDVIIPLLQHKLRLPLLPSTFTGQLCPCCTKTPQPLDTYGDHLFTCNGIVKTVFHNAIRDALFFICQQLAPSAAMVHTRHDISRESHVEGTTKRPADVGLLLRPSAMHTPPIHPVSLLALDVTVTSSPSLSTVARPDPHLTPVTLVHHSAQRWKLYCHQCNKKATGFSCKQWVQWCLDQGILRLPFTVDPFLGIGALGHSFLFGATRHPPDPLPSTFLARPHPAAATAFSLAMAAPRALLPKADSAHKDPDLTFKPSVWATRTLGLNASTGMAKHIHYGISLLNGTTQPPDDTDFCILGAPYSVNPGMNTLEALPLALHVGT